MIHLNVALQRMNSKEIFDIEFVKYNRKTKKGGEVVAIKNCMSCGLNHSMKKNDTIGIRPAHNSSHPIPVHIRLITKFNGETIHY